MTSYTLSLRHACDIWLFMPRWTYMCPAMFFFLFCSVKGDGTQLTSTSLTCTGVRGNETEKNKILPSRNRIYSILTRWTMAPITCNLWG